MKKILIIIFTLFSFNSYALDKSTTFTNEIFKKAQADGKTVVINSWNKTCYTCGKQVKILDEQRETFVNTFASNNLNFLCFIPSRFHKYHISGPF